jgi:hypothetical protein
MYLKSVFLWAKSEKSSPIEWFNSEHGSNQSTCEDPIEEVLGIIQILFVVLNVWGQQPQKDADLDDELEDVVDDKDLDALLEVEEKTALMAESRQVPGIMEALRWRSSHLYIIIIIY